MHLTAGFRWSFDVEFISWPTMENSSTEKSASSLSNVDPRLQSSYLIQTMTTTEVDAIRAGANYTYNYSDIYSTFLSMVFRVVAIFFNIRLAYNFHCNGESNYFVWTIACIVITLGVTSWIQCYMCYDDGKFDKGPFWSILTCLLILGSSVFLRYLNSFIYAIRCKRAEINGDKESQIRYYKLAVREESDVAFIRLFECFLESAPQKILQIYIVLIQDVEINSLQAIVISLNFGSMAWCLGSYQRYMRYAQEDKYNINMRGLCCHLCWHFCISVSRTLCIAFVATVFPLWTLVYCFARAALFGATIFLFDRPSRPTQILANLIFCFIFGIIYLFTYISTRDEATRLKYFIYYSICTIEVSVSILLFVTYAPVSLKSSFLVFHLLCASVIAFYGLGILVMIMYYTQFHPQITARQSKRLRVNNN